MRIAIIFFCLTIAALGAEPDFWILAESNAYTKASYSFEKVGAELRKTCSAPKLWEMTWDRTNTIKQIWGSMLFMGAAKQLEQKSEKFGPSMYTKIVQDVGATTKDIYTGTNAVDLAKLIEKLKLVKKDVEP